LPGDTEVRGIKPLVGENVGVQLPGQTSELPDGVDCIDPDLLEKLRIGSIDKLPERALDCVPADVRDRIPDELIEFASANPEAALVAVVVAVLATVVFLYKLARRAFFVALVAGAVAAVAWWWWLAEPNIV
jgi:hypothetical protein